MALTDINSEDRLVQQTFADHLRDKLGWDSVYAYNTGTFGPHGTLGTLGRANEREVVLVRDLRAALVRLNPELPESAREQAIEKLTRVDFARSLLQHNREFYGFIRGGVPVERRDAKGEARHREKLKQASKSLLDSLCALLKPMQAWTQNTSTQAEVKVFILDNLWRSLPRPPFTEEEAEVLADRVYDFVWQQSAGGQFMHAA